MRTVTTLAFACTAIALVGCGGAGGGPAYVGVLSLVAEGAVEWKPTGAVDWQKAGFGELIQAGDEIRTTDQGFAQLELRDGMVEIRVGPNTAMTLEEESDEGDAKGYRIRLDRGFLRLRNHQVTGEGIVHVHTAVVHAKARFSDFLILHEATDSVPPAVDGNGAAKQEAVVDEGHPPAGPDANEEAADPGAKEEAVSGGERPADPGAGKEAAEGGEQAAAADGTNAPDSDLLTSEPALTGRTTVTAFYGYVFVQALRTPEHPWIGPMNGSSVVVDPNGFDPSGIRQLTAKDLAVWHARTRPYTIPPYMEEDVRRKLSDRIRERNARVRNGTPSAGGNGGPAKDAAPPPAPPDPGGD